MRVIDIAKSYVGQTEISGNMGFNDKEFDKKMRAVGFQDTHAWCAYFSELVFKEAYPDKFKEFDKLFSASAVKTFDNFKNAGYPISSTPVPGSLVIWQTQKNGKPQWTGHAGICISVSGDSFTSIEGNTNSSGGREGIEVAIKYRKVQKVQNGLQVLGFVKI